MFFTTNTIMKYLWFSRPEQSEQLWAVDGYGGD